MVPSTSCYAWNKTVPYKFYIGTNLRTMFYTIYEYEINYNLNLVLQKVKFKQIFQLVPQELQFVPLDVTK